MNIANRLGVLLRLVMVKRITSRMMRNAGRIGQVHERTRICLAVCNDTVGCASGRGFVRCGGDIM